MGTLKLSTYNFKENMTFTNYSLDVFDSNGNFFEGFI